MPEVDDSIAKQLERSLLATSSPRFLEMFQSFKNFGEVVLDERLRKAQ